MEPAVEGDMMDVKAIHKRIVSVVLFK